jgi:hypothetical protein
MPAEAQLASREQAMLGFAPDGRTAPAYRPSSRDSVATALASGGSTG